MTKARFIHLRVHTEYSLLEGALPLKTLIKRCAAMGMPAVAVSDTNALFAALEFAVSAQEAGVQPIIGCQIDVQLPARQPGEKPRPAAPLVLLAQDEAGYDNLMALNSCLYLRGDGALPHVTPDDLARHSAGLICLTGGPDGLLGWPANWRFISASTASISKVSSSCGALDMEQNPPAQPPR